MSGIPIFVSIGNGRVAVHGQSTGTPPPLQPVGPKVGVLGTSDDGVGVRGESVVGGLPGAGIPGALGTSDGVLGVSGGTAVRGQSFGGTGVAGETTLDNVRCFGFLGGRDLVSHQHAGVYGESDQQGVYGHATGDKGTGVYGHNGGHGFGVRGEATDGVAVQGRISGSGLAGEFIGPVVASAQQDAPITAIRGDPRLQETTVASEGGRAGIFGASDIGAGVLGYARNPAAPAVFAFGGLLALQLDKKFAGEFHGDVLIERDLQVRGDLFLPGADCSEFFDVASLHDVNPGTVMVMTDSGTLEPCRRSYDKRVVGIVSGGGKFRTGILLDKQDTNNPRIPIALIGKVYCKTDAQSFRIEVGDLLTSSSTPGHAMKAVDSHEAFGAVIGKALQPLASGCGLIPILITLQ